MALYRLSIKIVKEHIGAKVAYIERQGKYSRGSKAEELRESWSSNLPSWAANSQDFWKDIELEEKPGQTQARGIELALPRELSPEEQKAIVQEFCETSLKGHAKTVAIHDSKDGKNPHVHIYFTERRIDDREEPPRGKYCRQRTGYSKAKEINGAGRKQWLVKIRKDWEDIQNDALLTCEYSMNGGEIKQVSAASYEARGILRQPQIHVGYKEMGRFKKTGEKGERFRRNEAINRENTAFIREFLDAWHEKERLETLVKAEQKEWEEREAAAKKAEEAAKKAAEAAQKAAEERRRMEAEAARRAADDEARKAKEEEERRRKAAEEAKKAAEAAQKAAEEREAEAAQKAAEAAKAAQKEPEPKPERLWLSDKTMQTIAGTWFNAKVHDEDTEQMAMAISHILPGKIDFSKIPDNDRRRLCEAARAILGGARRGAKIQKSEVGRRVFSQILEAAKMPEKAVERPTPERRSEPEKQPEIVKTKVKEKNRGMER